MVVCLGMPLIAGNGPPGKNDPPPALTAAQQAARCMEAQAEAARKVLQAALVQYRAAAGLPAQAAVNTGGFFLLPPLGTVAADCPPLPLEQVNPIIDRAAAREGLKPDLLRAVVKRESGFRTCAVSPKGAVGLMQLMPATVTRFGVADPFDPQANIETGAKFLKELLDRYTGDLRLALAAYNAGPAKVDEAAGVPAIPETQDYVREILAGLQ